jgi:hypothetical protein
MRLALVIAIRGVAAGARPAVQVEARARDRDGPVILRLTGTTAHLLGESSAEWHALEDSARLGQWTSGDRKDEGQLRRLAEELRVPLRVEDVSAAS